MGGEVNLSAGSGRYATQWVCVVFVFFCACGWVGGGGDVKNMRFLQLINDQVREYNELLRHKEVL